MHWLKKWGLKMPHSSLKTILTQGSGKCKTLIFWFSIKHGFKFKGPILIAQAQQLSGGSWLHGLCRCVQARLLFWFMHVQLCKERKGRVKVNIYQRVGWLMNTLSHITGLIALKQVCQLQWCMTTKAQQMKDQPLQEITLLSGWCRFMNWCIVWCIYISSIIACLRLSSHLCTVQSALGTRIPHRSGL